MQNGTHQRGTAALEVDLVFRQSTVTGVYATSPLKLLTPRSRGSAVFTYASNFGGGLVAGDQTKLDLRIGRGARCFVGSQASTKIYRNPSSLPCGHRTQARVEEGALLVFAPAPVQPFAESTYAQKQEFHLSSGAGLALLDWFTSGRSACGERWAFSRFTSRNEVWQSARGRDPTDPSFAASPDRLLPEPGDECIFLDSLSLDSTDGPLDSPYRTGRFNCFAMLLLLGPLLKDAADNLLAEVNSRPVGRRSRLLVSASPNPHGAVLRLAGEDLSELETYVREQLTPLRNLLGDDPWCRKW